MEKVLNKYISKFDDKNKHSEIHFPIINGEKYFVKVVGKNKKEHMKNEVKSLKELSKMFLMYKNYLVAFKEEENHFAIMLRYIEGEDLKSLLKHDFDIPTIICLYKMLLAKLRIFHEKEITHGDIKPQNFFSYIDTETGIIRLKLIDTETCTIYKNIKSIDEIKRLRSLYYYLPDNPRSSDFFTNKEEAFIFFRYLDNYSLACFMLYLYKPKVYEMIRENKYKIDDKNPWRFDKNDLRNPYDYVDKDDKVGSALHYVFKYIPTKDNYKQLELFNEDKLFDILS
jgi:serine/threonine protein kinase